MQRIYYKDILRTLIKSIYILSISIINKRAVQFNQISKCSKVFFIIKHVKTYVINTIRYYDNAVKGIRNFKFESFNKAQQ